MKTRSQRLVSYENVIHRNISDNMCMSDLLHHALQNNIIEYGESAVETDSSGDAAAALELPGKRPGKLSG